MTDINARDAENQETEVETTETVDTVETEVETDVEQEDVDSEDIVKIPKQELEKLRAAVRKNNKQNEKNRLRLKDYEVFGTPEQIAESFTKLSTVPDEAEAQKATTALLEKERAKVRSAMEKEIEAAKAEAEKYKANWYQTAVDKEVTRVLAQHTDMPELFIPKLKEMISYVEDDEGKLHIRIKDESGEFEINNSGEYAGIEDAVLKLREHRTYSKLFRAPKAPSGANLNPAKKDISTVPTVKKSKMSEKDKIDFIAKYGITEYKKLKD